MEKSGLSTLFVTDRSGRLQGYVQAEDASDLVDKVSENWMVLFVMICLLPHLILCWQISWIPWPVQGTGGGY